MREIVVQVVIGRIGGGTICTYGCARVRGCSRAGLQKVIRARLHGQKWDVNGLTTPIARTPAGTRPT